MKKHKSQWTMLHEIMASSTDPLPVDGQLLQIGRMRQALHNIEAAESPTPDDWRICSDAVNCMETLLTQGTVLTAGKSMPGWWIGCDGEPVQVVDRDNLLMDALAALAYAGQRKFTHGVIRLDGRGLVAVRALIEDYASLIEVLPARAVIRVYRLTEKRIDEIMANKSQSHDVFVPSLG